MFRQLYEACAGAFVLQGALLVPLLIAAGFAWVRQGARMKAVEAALGGDRARRDRTLRSLLTALPTLTPLNCPACGGRLALEVASTVCTSCDCTFPAPPDYVATISLRRRLKRLTNAALFHWYQARVLTSAPLRLLLRLMVVGEPAIFAITVIGAATYADTWLDRMFAAAGERLALALMLLSFGGFIVWMVTFIMLAGLSRELRRKLPDFPVVARRDAAPTGMATCRSCGGGMRYDGGAFAALCGYCGVENYRADYGRRELGKAQGERVSTRASLFGAMEIIEAFTGTFFVTMAILITGFLLLVAVIAVRD